MSHVPSNILAGLRVRLVPFGFLLLLAMSVEYAKPFFENQNQYFAHAVAYPTLSQDWFFKTTDPYPAFSTLAQALLTFSQTTALVLAVYLANVAALGAVFLFALRLKPASGKREPLSPYIATTLVAASLVTIPGGHWVFYYSLFNGLGGQYIISKPSYLQPSAAGALLLLGFYLWIFPSEKTRINWPAFGLAAALTVFACILHPTYLIASAMGLGLLAVARYWTEGRNRFIHYIAIGVVIVALIALLNPAVFNIGRASAAYEAALTRFAYERIPGHSLWQQWPIINLLYPLVIAGGAWVAAYYYGEKLLGLWLFLALAGSLASAVFLPLLPTAKFVLMFPWRLSVCLVPIGAAVLGRRIADLCLARWRLSPLSVAVVVCLLAIYGLSQTALHWRATEEEAAVNLLLSARPSGVGVVPVDQGVVRLNVPAAIYVDRKSPPYASEDLIEWWRRVDLVNQLYHDPERFCRTRLDQKVDWLLMPAEAPLLSCTGRWRAAERNSEWQLYRRHFSNDPTRSEN